MGLQRVGLDITEQLKKNNIDLGLKTFNKVGIEGTHLYIIKTIYGKHTDSIIHNCEKLKAFPLRSGTTKMSTLSTLIQDSFGSHNHSNQGRKRKQVQIGKEEVKLSLFRDDMILYIDNPDDATRK